MSENSNDSLALVIDTSRQRPHQLRNTKNRSSLFEPHPTPGTSCSTISIPWSDSTSATPSTGATSPSPYNSSAYYRHLPLTPGSTTADPCYLITKIDEYLAELHAPTFGKNTKSPRRSLRIEINSELLSSAETALPSSPDAIRSTQGMTLSPLLTSARARPASMPASPSIFEADFGSPLFYRTFQRPDGQSVCEDAAPFPYSPCRESVSVEPGNLRGSISNRLSELEQSRTSSPEDVVKRSSEERVESICEGRWNPTYDGKKDGSESNEVPLPRIDTVDKTGTSSSRNSDIPAWTTPQSSPTSVITSPSSCECIADIATEVKDTKLPWNVMECPVIITVAGPSPPDESSEPNSEAQPRLCTTPESRAAVSSYVQATKRSHTVPLAPPSALAHRPGLSRSASVGNLHLLSSRTLPFGATDSRALASSPHVPKQDKISSKSTAFALVKGDLDNRLAPLPPSSANTTSPTSTQIIEGVRRMNKLKKLLGEEVGSHVLVPARLPIPQASLSSIAPFSPCEASDLRRANTMKPLPLIPNSKGFEEVPVMRSQIILGSHKRKQGEKVRGCLATSSTGRPSTARERCGCEDCIEMEKVSQRLLAFALAGSSLHLTPPRGLHRSNSSCSVGATPCSPKQVRPSNGR
ncbi:uncharacterized protein MEPE_01987 [Melanopsichium pennsylvanicum]|uniref:Uncharacterized protein n=2 Tax=Melanopsichium pennsylvanicum TaxID=63383 RepID=A0AAJ5C440_9BASI|nr:putative protein [Melanopsichium pennsylvanicum 4]SNX83280.1 uncharacterized protein MEPE_01987 [Melanopsichium pennsylvanicum]